MKCLNNAILFSKEIRLTRTCLRRGKKEYGRCKENPTTLMEPQQVYRETAMHEHTAHRAARALRKEMNRYGDCK